MAINKKSPITEMTDHKDRDQSRMLEYFTPKTNKHAPLNIVRGSGSSTSGGGGASLYTGGLYTECSLYYYY